MFKSIFQKAGLTPTQAAIMEYLFNNKEEKASEISRAIKKSRAIVYKDLEEMLGLGLVERIDKPNAISYFRAGHPGAMEKHFDEREEKIKKDRQLFMNYLPDMVSSYNLLSNKPGVRYYEGMDGVEKILSDSLSAHEAIRTYIDIEAIVKYINDINKEYVKKREKLGIKKRGLVLDSEYAREYLKNYHSEITDTKFLDKNSVKFETIMQIYDNKISYLTLSEKSRIGVIIEDPSIAQMHKTLFDLNWNNAKDYAALSKAQ